MPERFSPRGPANELSRPLLQIAGTLAALLLTACSSAPPDAPDDICAVFEERPGWYDDVRDAQDAWGLPIHVGMAFVHRESSYVSDARPPRETLLWVIPWLRPSSAYGYAQATREAWQDYRDATGRLLADRSLSRLLKDDWPRSLSELEEKHLLSG